MMLMNPRRAAALRLLVLGMLLATAAAAQEPQVAHSTSRPRIGLVLGGGGAKGAAHVGVLRVLDELRIPIDCIAGTSMGALVGATLAAGMAPEEIEAVVRDIDWTETVGSRGLRDATPIDYKLAGVNYSNGLELGIANGRVRTPGGLIGTQNIDDLIRTLVADARFTDDFDELPIPFRAVATDMVAGEMVVLGTGDLAAAMRASMAIPGAFAPITLDERVLADGGMMRNLPVDVARNMCADVVIAVWMSSPSLQPEDVASALSVLRRSLDVSIGANQREQIATLTAEDIGIDVPMADIGTEDFQRVPEAIDLGRAAAERLRADLLRLSVPEDEYRAWARAARRQTGETITVADVRVTGLNRVDPAYVRAQLRSTAPGSEISTADIAADTARLYATGDFESVGYRVTGSDDERVLEIEPTEKSWGPDFFGFDLGLAADTQGDLAALLRADHRRTWINARGGQWHNALQVGRRALMTSDFYQPLDVGHRYFVHPIGMLVNDLEDIYIDGDRAAQYYVRELYSQIDFGMNVGTRAQVRVGLRTGVHEADLDTGLPGLPELARTSDTSVQARLVYDTRDSVGLPTRGTFVNARYARSEEWLGGELDYGLLEGVVQQAFSLRGNSLSVIAGGAKTLSGDLPITQEIELGGIRTFPGLQPGELRGDGYWYAGATYSWRLFDLQPLFGQALYAGLRVQAGEMRNRLDDVDDGTLYGIAGTVSGRTPVGPFLLSLGYVDNGSWELQFTIGRPIPEGSLLDEIH
jgi:NTE family protein